MHDLTDILIDVIFILLHLFLFLFNYNVAGKKVYQPAVLFSLIWFIMVALHFFFRLTILGELYPLSINTYTVFFIGVAAFSFGALVINLKKKGVADSNLSKQNSTIKISLLLRLMFTGIILVGLPFYIQAAIKLFIASESENFFHGLRHEISYGDVDFGPTKYLLSFSFVVFALSIYAYISDKNIINRILLIICLLATTTYAVLATGRIFLFMILVLYLGINFLQNKNFSIKKYAFLVLLFIPIFMAYGILYGKGGNVDSSLKDNLKTSTEAVAIYLATPLSAFNLENKKFIEPNYIGDNTLRFFAKTGQQIGLLPNKKVNNLVQEFVFVPYETNVYTYYSPYMKDFGILYAYIVLALLGALHTWLCNKAVASRTFRYTLYYSFLIYPLLMSFFQDQYLSLFSTWFETIVFIEIALFLNRFLVKTSTR